MFTDRNRCKYAQSTVSKKSSCICPKMAALLTR